MNIKKIAKLANVSIATVSRVVNNRPGVRKEIREKIEKIIKETNYRPNQMARGLVQKKSNVIGLLIPRFDGYYSERAEAVLRVCNQNDYSVMIASAVEEYGGELDSLKLLYEKHIEGLIFFSAHYTPRHKELMKRISEQIPVVFVDMAEEDLNIPSILQDNYDGARKAMKYLIQCGHRKIAFISSPYSDKEAVKRQHAYVDTLKEEGIKINEKYIREGTYSIDSGYREMGNILKLSKDRPTAVFCANDNMAIGAINCLKANGLEVPGDMSVVGFDDILIAKHFIPALTTVRQDQEAIGTQAAELLIEYKKNSEFRVKKIILHQELIIRDSVKDISELKGKEKGE
jgi:DNA-binding LacI/PurR family transcriptional regulator